MLPGSHSITAVYSGDDYFAGNQSTQSVTVQGDQPTILLTEPGESSEASVVVLAGNVSGLDNAGFTLYVTWGDGQSGDCGNGGQPFCFAAGTTQFAVTHVYMLNGSNTTVSTLPDGEATAAETFSISAGLVADDGRGTDPENPATTTVAVLDPEPLVHIDATPDGSGGYYFVATGYEPWDPGASFTSTPYQWNTPDVSATGPSLTLNAQQWQDALSGGGTLTFTDENGAAGVIGANTWLGLPSIPPSPTETISAADPGGMVFEGDVAHFDVHMESTVYWTLLPEMPAVYYNTVDAAGVAPTDYQSTRGPQVAELGPATYGYDSATQMYTADYTIAVNTVGGINDGQDGSVTVQLTNPWWWNIGATATATETIVHPEVDITSPGSASGEFDVSDDGSTRTEVDLHAKVDAYYASNTSLQLSVPEGVGDLTFWDSPTGGRQLVPDANDVLETFDMQSTGTFSGSVYVSYGPAKPARRRRGRLAIPLALSSLSNSPLPTGPFPTSQRP